MSFIGNLVDKPSSPSMASKAMALDCIVYGLSFATTSLYGRGNW